MWQIAESQFYQLGKESIIKIIFLLILAVQTISVVSYVISGMNDETAVSAGQLTAELFPAMATFPFIFILSLRLKLFHTPFFHYTIIYLLFQLHFYNIWHFLYYLPEFTLYTTYISHKSPLWRQYYGKGVFK